MTAYRVEHRRGWNTTVVGRTADPQARQAELSQHAARLMRDGATGHLVLVDEATGVEAARRQLWPDPDGDAHPRPTGALGGPPTAVVAASRAPLSDAARRLAARATRGNRPALVVTDGALDVLAERRAAQRGRPAQALGLVAGASGQIGLVLDVPGAGDRVFARHGVAVFFVAAPLRDRLAGHVLDHAGSPGRARFSLSPASGAAAGSGPGRSVGAPHRRPFADHDSSASPAPIPRPPGGR